jgi:hypothetical protein
MGVLGKLTKTAPHNNEPNLLAQIGPLTAQLGPAVRPAPEPEPVSAPLPGSETARCLDVKVVITPDRGARDTTWKLADRTGAVALNGRADGPLQVEECLAYGLYMLTVYDSAGAQLAHACMRCCCMHVLLMHAAFAQACMRTFSRSTIRTALTELPSPWPSYSALFPRPPCPRLVWAHPLCPSRSSCAALRHCSRTPPFPMDALLRCFPLPHLRQGPVLRE